MNMMWDYSPSLCSHKQFSWLGKILFIFQISCLLHQSLVFSCILHLWMCFSARTPARVCVCSKMFVKSTSKKALIIFHLCCIYSTVAVQQLLQLFFFLAFFPLHTYFVLRIKSCASSNSTLSDHQLYLLATEKNTLSLSEEMRLGGE